MKKNILALVTVFCILCGLSPALPAAAEEGVTVTDLSCYKADDSGNYTMIYTLEAGKIKVNADLKNSSGSSVNTVLQVEVRKNGEQVGQGANETKSIASGETDYLAADVDVPDDTCELIITLKDGNGNPLMEEKTVQKQETVIVPNPGNALRPVSEKVALKANGVEIPVKREMIQGLFGATDGSGSRDSNDRYFNVAMFTMSEGKPVTIELTGLDAGIQDPLQVSPRALQIPRFVSKNKGYIVIDRPQTLVIRDWTAGQGGDEGYEDIIIYATPLETGVPYKHAQDITYYSPDTLTSTPGFSDGQKVYFDKGYYPNSGMLELKSNMEVYLAPGATLNSAVQMFNVSDVKLYGRGVLESRAASSGTGKGIYAKHSQNLTVEGIGLRSAYEWQNLYVACSNVKIDHFNTMGVVLNNDGIDIDGVQNFTITNNFVMCGDDGFGWHGVNYDEIRTSEHPYGQPTENITAINNVIYNVRGGNPVRIGSSMEQEAFRNITIKDTYVVVTETGFGFYIDCQDWAAISDMLVENFYIEELMSTVNCPIRIEPALAFYSRSNEGKPMPNGLKSPVGSIDKIYFKNFSSPWSGSQPPVWIGGYDKEHSSRNITFDNVKIQTGTKVFTGGERTQSLNYDLICFLPSTNKNDPEGVYVSKDDVTIK